MNFPRLWNILEIAVMDIGTRTNMHQRKEGLQKIYDTAKVELGFEKSQNLEIAELQDQLHRRNALIKKLRERIKELETFNNTFGDKRD